MATVNDVCSLAAILIDLCDDTDTNLRFILSVPKLHCRCIGNNMNLNSTLTIWLLPYCKRPASRVTLTAGIEGFLIAEK